MPQIESVKKMISPEDLWPVGKAWNSLCTVAGEGMHNTGVIWEAVSGQYGEPSTVEEFVARAQAADYTGTRGMYEAFRINIGKATGVVQWMLNSAWPSLYWQLYDWYGVPTAGYYGTKKACEPVQLIFDYDDRTVYLVNERPDDAPQALQASVKVYDASSRLIGEDSRVVNAAYRDVLPVFDLGRYDGEPHFVALSVSDGSGLLADNFYCIGAKDNEYDWDKTNWYITPITSYSDLGFAFSQRPAEVEVSVAWGEGEAEVILTNNSDAISYMNILRATDASGNLVVPAYWSDNFFPLLPGQTKTVTCRTDCKDLHISLDK